MQMIYIHFCGVIIQKSDDVTLRGHGSHGVGKIFTQVNCIFYRAVTGPRINTNYNSLQEYNPKFLAYKF